jgi:hypothetical protein
MIEPGFYDMTADRKLELALIEKHGRVHPSDEATSVDLARCLQRISEIAERVLLLKQKRYPQPFPFSLVFSGFC